MDLCGCDNWHFECDCDRDSYWTDSFQSNLLEEYPCTEARGEKGPPGEPGDGAGGGAPGNPGQNGHDGSDGANGVNAF